jgi:oxygen-dependent protoporphyrinogen oxidase
MRPSSHSKIEKVVVIGAGITGLVCARELIKNAQKSSRSVRVTLLESSPRIGGKIRSETLDDALIETGPDSFVTLKPEMIELINELGLRDELIGTAADATVSVLKDGRLLPMPSGMQLITPTRLLPFIFSPLFSCTMDWEQARHVLLCLLPKGSRNTRSRLAER